MDTLRSIKSRLGNKNPFARLPSPFLPMGSRREARPFKFYLGVFISTVGFLILMVGSFRKDWLLLSHPKDNLPNSTKEILPARFGPWKACRHNGQCDQLWEVLAGVDSRSTKISQAILAVIVAIYTISMIVISLQLFNPNWLHGRCCCFLRVPALPQAALTTAVVSNLLYILLMGQIKRNVIVRFNQTMSVGPGFALTLSGICLTAGGLIFMIVYRKRSSTSFMKRCLYRAALWTDNFKRNDVKKRGVTNTTDDVDTNLGNQTNTKEREEDTFDIKVHHPRQTKLLPGNAHHSNGSPDLKRQKTAIGTTNRDGDRVQQQTTDSNSNCFLPDGIVIHDVDHEGDGATYVQRRRPISNVSQPEAPHTHLVKVNVEQVQKQLNIEQS